MGASAAFGVVAWLTLVKPLYNIYSDRKHVWICCYSFDEATRVVGRVWAYTEMEPKTDSVFPTFGGKPYIIVRVPKIMLSATKFDEAIKKLKEPLNV